MKPRNISRRKFIAAALLAMPVVLTGDAKLLEPTWLKTRNIRIGDGAAGSRFVHFSDIHHKGDCDYLQTVVDRINSLAPDFVCFTGDIIEMKPFLPKALEILSDIKAPMFGVPGNHDFWSDISFTPVRECFAANGGAWLMDESRQIAGGKINLIGLACLSRSPLPPPSQPSAKNILLMHYPAWFKFFGGRKFDLMLAGHSHGGQVRIPFYGPPFLPYGVDQYSLGLYQTASGPLYVNPGIGYIGNYNVRFNCRPEITVIEI
jgi:uncharacterized protein